jgi:hypothetical protein
MPKVPATTTEVPVVPTTSDTPEIVPTSDIEKKRSSKKGKKKAATLEDVIHVLEARKPDACDVGLKMLKTIKTTPERAPRIKSGYNIFIRHKMKELKENNPEVPSKERMGAATKFWQAMSKDEQNAFGVSVMAERGIDAILD